MGRGSVGDEAVTLVLPRERDFHPVARLVLSGLASRRNLTYESLEDLQLALDGLLEREELDEELTVKFEVGEGVIAAEVGPFEPDGLRAELERDDPAVVGLGRLLDTLTDDVELEEVPAGIVVRLVKRIELGPPQS